METNFFDILTLLAVAYLLVTISKLEGRVKGLQHTVKRMSQQVGVEDDPLDDELRELLQAGEDVKAVKRARETFGFTLIEAKEYVDGLK